MAGENVNEVPIERNVPSMNASRNPSLHLSRPLDPR
jgi:hypothetical protein